MAAVDVLVVGSGGREHALAWKLRQSPRCGRLHAALGNAGIAEIAECHSVRAEDVDGLVRLARELAVGLVVVGPEIPLALGLVDWLEEAGILAFGPTAAAARIESSKAYARDLMTRAEVRQPAFGHFTEFRAASAYLDDLAGRGIDAAVVKASGLAAGKGAIVCDTLDEARNVAEGMLVEGSFGESGREIVIEERLQGEEVSLLVVTDGSSIVPFLPAQDYKRTFDGDAGPNTGGMGSYAPAPVLTHGELNEAVSEIVLPVLAALGQDGHPFRGCLYAGLMLTARGLRVIEFNCRFGDPETQALLPLLDIDLLELFQAAAAGDLAGHTVAWRDEKSVSVALVSGGYPGDYHTGKPIEGLAEAAALEGVTVFHAGTARREGEVLTSGGRVLNVTGTGPTFATAIDRAYAAADLIHFDGRFYRHDIAARVRES
jgi:phosphoribosylamine--glycine ligase